MKKINLLLIGGLLCTSLLSFSQDKKHLKEKKSKNDTHKKKTETAQGTATNLNNQIDSVSYSLGINIAANLKKQGFDTLNAELLGKAITDSYKKEGKIDENTAQSYLMEYFQEMQKSKADKNLKAGQKFLEENKKKPGVVTLPSGLQYMIIKEGTGPIPTSSDKVTTHYHGTLIDGTVFDSSVERGQPATFPVSGVIPGWVEALQLMPVGSKWKLFIPSDLAYGERGAGGKIGPNSVLIFDIELLSIEGK